MKNTIIIGFLGAALTLSCSGVKNAKVSQENRSEFLKMKGDWELISVDYDKNFKVKPFDENLDINCFVGSHWRLIPNNYSGSYTLKGGGNCRPVIQPIKFEVVSGNEFKFKKMLEGSKAKAVTEGYSLDLVNQTMDGFSLQQNVPSDGENVKIVYNFQRTGMK